MLLSVKPVQGLLKSLTTTHTIVLSSIQANLDLTTPQINKITHSVIEETGCNCANCVQTNLDKLQGKLPMIGV